MKPFRIIRPYVCVFVCLVFVSRPVDSNESGTGGRGTTGLPQGQSEPEGSKEEGTESPEKKRELEEAARSEFRDSGFKIYFDGSSSENDFSKFTFEQDLCKLEVKFGNSKCTKIVYRDVNVWVLKSPKADDQYPESFIFHIPKNRLEINFKNDLRHVYSYTPETWVLNYVQEDRKPKDLLQTKVNNKVTDMTGEIYKSGNADIEVTYSGDSSIGSGWSEYVFDEKNGLMRLEFGSKIQCFEFKYRRAKVWEHSREVFGNYYPKRIVLNTRTMNFSVHFDDQWYCDYLHKPAVWKLESTESRTKSAERSSVADSSKADREESANGRSEGGRYDSSNAKSVSRESEPGTVEGDTGGATGPRIVDRRVDLSQDVKTIPGHPDIDIITRDSRGSGYKVNDFNRYTVERSLNQVAYTFNEGNRSRCIEVRFKDFTVWSHDTSEHGENYPRSVAFNTDSNMIYVYFNEDWYYSYWFVGKRWVLNFKNLNGKSVALVSEKAKDDGKEEDKGGGKSQQKDDKIEGEGEGEERVEAKSDKKEEQKGGDKAEAMGDAQDAGNDGESKDNERKIIRKGRRFKVTTVTDSGVFKNESSHFSIVEKLVTTSFNINEGVRCVKFEVDDRVAWMYDVEEHQNNHPQEFGYYSMHNMLTVYLNADWYYNYWLVKESWQLNFKSELGKPGSIFLMLKHSFNIDLNISSALLLHFSGLRIKTISFLAFLYPGMDKSMLQVLNKLYYSKLFNERLSSIVADTDKLMIFLTAVKDTDFILDEWKLNDLISNPNRLVRLVVELKKVGFSLDNLLRTLVNDERKLNAVLAKISELGYSVNVDQVNRLRKDTGLLSYLCIKPE